MTTPPSTTDTPDFNTLFQAGQQAFERGRYQESITLLDAAGQQVMRASRQGGEVQLWLVNAYQAAGDVSGAIALCESLLAHPFVAKKANDLLYILKAPVLERPKEWLTEIPDFNDLDESQLSDRYVTTQSNTAPSRPQSPEPEEDWTPVTAQDDQFVVIALTILVMVFGCLAFLA